MSEGTVDQVLAGEAAWCVLHGDSFRVLCDIPENSCDSGMIDPPAGIGFMNKDWDGDKGGMREWIGWLACILERTMRALKPGAHAMIWALPRTSHWTGMAIEYAGFEIRHVIQHQFGSGFPKSLDLAKAIDAHFGAERKVIGSRTLTGTAALSTKDKGGTFSAGVASDGHVKEVAITEAATPEAQQWSGYGTALKPGHEIWWLVRKPLEKGLTVAENVLKWGTGAINIDAGRIASGTRPLRLAAGTSEKIPGWGGLGQGSLDAGNTGDGRFPADVVFTHDHRCRRLGTVEVPANPTWDTPNRNTEPSAFTGSEVSKVRHANCRDGEASAEKRYTDRGSSNFAPTPGARRDATETVDRWECAEGCPALELDRQTGALHGAGSKTSGEHCASLEDSVGYSGGFGPRNCPRFGDSGTASRFFQQFEWDPELDDIGVALYAAKPSRAERDAGLDHFRPRSAAEATDSEEGQARLASPRTGAGRTGGARNSHPTVKGREFLEYWTRIITPPKGVVFTPFAGSGSEGTAAVRTGYRFIGIEMSDTDEEPHVSIARARISYVEGRTFVPRESLRAAEPPKQRSLF